MRSPIFTARVLISTLGFVALASCGGGGQVGVELGAPAFGQPAPQQLADTFAATLAAPDTSQGASVGHGAGTVVINPVSRHMTAVAVTIGVNATSAFIRQTVPDAPGISGPIMVALVEAPIGSGVWAATAILSDAQIDALRAGDWFFDLQSIFFPSSELRGQLLPQFQGAGPPATSGGATFGSGSTPVSGFGAGPGIPENFAAALRGANNVPPTSSVAEGAGTATVNPSTRQITAAINVTGMAPTSAEIRIGPPGFNGALALNLIESFAASGVWLARTTLNEQLLTSLRAGNLYFSVQSAAFPGGEIRGQLTPQQAAAPSAAVPVAASGIGAGAAGAGAGFGAFDSGIPELTPAIPALDPALGTTGFGTTGIAPTDFGGGFSMPGTFTQAGQATPIDTTNPFGSF